MAVQTWMPDNKRILATSYDLRIHTQQLHLISVPEGTIRDIGQAVTEEIGRAYPSPNGRHIAFTRKDDIFIYDTLTEQESVFIQNPSTETLVGWTPDGSGIVFISNRSGTHDLYLMGVENGRSHGNMQLLRKDFGANPGMSLTSNGRLYRIENTGMSDSYIVQLDEHTGKLTGTPSLVDPDHPDVAYAGWSPDGKLLYYELHKEASREFLLLIREEATGQIREIMLKPRLNFWYGAILSPDGTRFAVTGEDANMNFGIFALDAESGEVSELARIPSENEPVSPSQNWSPDGTAIFYKVRSLENSNEFIIRRKDLTTGEEKDIHRGFHTREMQISRDGSRFAYFRHDIPTRSFVVGILDIQSGRELELWRFPETESPEVYNTLWTPDEKYVLVARDFKEGTELWRIPSVGGPGEKLHFSPELQWGFVIHPDGKKMAFRQVQRNSELWVMENFLPK